MADLPHTYTDEGGDQIHVHHSYLTVVHSGESGVALLPDADADRAELARAVLGEDAGHRVVSEEELREIRESAQRRGEALTRKMAIRAANEAPAGGHALADRIRALPLLPEGDTPSCSDGPATRSGHRYVCEDDQGHDGLHHALGGSVTWGIPTVVHVATPEGITPCGEGHHDVPVAALIDEATCVECLRTLAQLNGAARPVTDYNDEHDTLPDRVAQLERDIRHVEKYRIGDLENRLRPIEYDLGPTVYDPADGVLLVCSAADPGPGGICGTPVENEPCREHSLAGRLDAVMDRLDALEQEADRV